MQCASGGMVDSKLTSAAARTLRFFLLCTATSDCGTWQHQMEYIYNYITYTIVQLWCISMQQSVGNFQTQQTMVNSNNTNEIICKMQTANMKTELGALY